MRRFMDEDFLLTTQSARTLYHHYAEKMPIIDYHCHVSPREICENRRFADLFEVWLEGDHYKWRLMRADGVDERFITGDASHREKFQKFAETLPRAIGNPLSHWCHLELKRYFGYDGVLNGGTAQEIWDLCNAKLQESDMAVRGIIEKSNVAFIGTTDDPADTLEWHERLAADSGMKTVTAPSFRPDRALNLEKPGWADYLSRLGKAAGVEITGVEALKEALSRRMALFDRRGCRASDHGLDYVPFRKIPAHKVEAVFQKARRGETVAAEDADAFKTDLLIFCAGEYQRLGWAMQIHYNCVRNPNSAMFLNLGPDTGFDCMANYNCTAALHSLLDELYKTGALPKTILYSLNPSENAVLDTIIGAFQGPGASGKIQHGAAWWFNDHKSGMAAQLTSLGSLGVLGNFVGMLTDSRSFLSYTRHEYFRRVLCDLFGSWVENGEYPDGLEAAGGLVEDICFYNAARYFGLEDRLCT